MPFTRSNPLLGSRLKPLCNCGRLGLNLNHRHQRRSSPHHSRGTGMYTRFWGFREKPFRQVPNPEFLFLSQTHEEALAHLNYVLVEGEGFLMITGEVGTGKSTLCRAFFQKLAADTACAYIFNSKLDPLQLLKSINAEFGIAAEEETSKALTDVLNNFLIEKRRAGHKAIIVIDEAQNLPVESLEQVRLLSNLETTHEKLLHLVLVGQPELGDMIDSFALRQLGQRIHLACHLQPLTFAETVAYIRHRIHLVSEKPQMPFEKGALRAIYAFSKGVPRLINTACDRMLLAAYLKNRSRISAGMASRIVEELVHRGRRPAPAISWARMALSVSLVAAVAATAWYFIAGGQVGYLSAKVSKPQTSVSEGAEMQRFQEDWPERIAKTTPQIVSTSFNSDSKSEDAQAVDVPVPTAMPLDEWQRAIQHENTRHLALETVLRQWGLQPHGDMAMPGTDDAAFFDLVAERHGLSILTIEEDDIDTLVVLDLPAVIPLKNPGSNRPLYAGLAGLQDDGHFYLKLNGQDSLGQTDALNLMRHWSGEAFVVWKNYMGYEGIIPGGAPRPAVVSLKQLLWESGYPNLVIDDQYDEATRNAIKEVQTEHGLQVDGLVGDRTRIVLFNEKRSLPIPHLSHWPAAVQRMN